MNSRNGSRDRKRPRTASFVTPNSGLPTENTILSPSKNSHLQTMANQKDTKNQPTPRRKINRSNGATKNNQTNDNNSITNNNISSNNYHRTGRRSSNSHRNSINRDDLEQNSPQKRKSNVHQNNRQGNNCGPQNSHTPNHSQAKSNKRQIGANDVITKDMKEKEDQIRREKEEKVQKENEERIQREKDERIQKEKDESRAAALLQNSVNLFLETEITCPICQDIYINPMVIGCSHSFCKFCVYQWLHNKSACPTCRKPVKFITENLALKNVVVKLVGKSSQEFQDQRNESVARRLVDEEKQAKNGIKGLKKNSTNDHNNDVASIHLLYQRALPRHTFDTDVPNGFWDVVEGGESESQSEEDHDDDDDESEDDDDVPIEYSEDEYNEDEPETSYGSSFYDLFDSDSNQVSEETGDSEESEEYDERRFSYGNEYSGSSSSDNIDESVDSECSSESMDEGGRSTDGEEGEYSSNESSFHIEDEDNYTDEDDDDNDDDDDEDDDDDDEGDDDDGDDDEDDSDDYDSYDESVYILN